MGSFSRESTPWFSGSWVRYPIWQHTFVSPSAFSRRAVVSYWRKYVHEVLVNRLGGLSLPRKSVVRLTDRPDMTLDVYRGRKTTIQEQQQPWFSVFASLVNGSQFLSGRVCSFCKEFHCKGNQTRSYNSCFQFKSDGKTGKCNHMPEFIHILWHLIRSTIS